MKKIQLFAIFGIILAFNICSVHSKFGQKPTNKEKDMLRKSIVFDEKTPDVFYCPTQKPASMNKLIVRARPLRKLCEYEGKPMPSENKSDCYQNIDETDYACTEKYRIMKRFVKEDLTTLQK